jgi:hypothetical protein
MRTACENSMKINLKAGKVMIEEHDERESTNVDHTIPESHTSKKPKK